MENAQDYLNKQISSTERLVESMIEFNTALFKGNEAMTKKVYENYVTNVAASFDGVKALNKSADVSEFLKTASSNAVGAAERYVDQNKKVAELSGKVLKETSEAARLAFSKSFSANS